MLVLFSKIPGREYSDMILSSLPMLPLSYKERLNRYKRWQDVQASLLGRSLLIKGMSMLNQDIDLDDISYTEYGKPFLDSSLIKFNISHSGDWAVCALVAGGEIGIDIQQITIVSLKGYERIISESDYNSIKDSVNVDKTFLNFWVRREAICKADGRGILAPFESIEIMRKVVSIGDTSYFLNRIEFDPGYICYTATSVENAECVVKVII